MQNLLCEESLPLLLLLRLVRFNNAHALDCWSNELWHSKTSEGIAECDVSFLFCSVVLWTEWLNREISHRAFIHILLDDIYVVYKMSEDGEYCPIAIPQSLQWLILVWPAVQNSKHQVCYHIRQTEAADLLPSFVIVAWKMTRMTNWLSKSVWMTNQFKWTASGL